MAQGQDAFGARAAELAAAGAELYRRGWLPATSGNLSARLDGGRLAITVSGTHKGRLTTTDVMVVDGGGNALEAGLRPSAETLLHVARYRADPAVGAVLHVHSPAATVLSLAAGGDLLRLSGYEILKAFPGVTGHEDTLEVPVFENDQDIPRLARAVEARIGGRAGIHGYLIRGHGLYAWGPDVARTLVLLEAFDFLFDCQLRLGAS